MDSHDRETAAFDKYWDRSCQIAYAGIFVLAIVCHKAIVPVWLSAVIILIAFLDVLRIAIRWLNRRDDPHDAKRPPDAP
jgi:hypothetical protein